MSSFVLDTAAVHHLTHDPGGIVGMWLDDIAARVALEAEGLAPVGDGKDPPHLFETIERTNVHPVVDGVATEVGSNKRYAAAVVKGAQPHVIRARNKPLLVFMGRDGHLVSKREVNHPGNQPNDFLSEAAAHIIPGA